MSDDSKLVAKIPLSKYKIDERLTLYVYQVGENEYKYSIEVQIRRDSGGLLRTKDGYLIYSFTPNNFILDALRRELGELFDTEE